MAQRSPLRRAPSPLELLRDMRDEMDQLMRSTLRTPAAQLVGFDPAVDIRETDDALILTAELPGMKSDEIDIELDNNVLTIRGEKKEERREKGEERYVVERLYGTFSRSFTLPHTVDPNRITARFEVGVLTVTLPKVEEARGKRKRIEVQGGERKH